MFPTLNCYHTIQPSTSICNFCLMGKLDGDYQATAIVLVCCGIFFQPSFWQKKNPTFTVGCKGAGEVWLASLTALHLLFRMAVVLIVCPIPGKPTPGVVALLVKNIWWRLPKNLKKEWNPLQKVHFTPGDPFRIAWESLYKIIIQNGYCIQRLY